jgi:hypothetical protein
MSVTVVERPSLTMTRIETTAVVGEDRTLTVQLPSSVSPGEHAVVVLVDGSEIEDDIVVGEGNPTFETGGLRWKDGVLVWNGELPSDFDIVRFFEDERDERIRLLWGGSDHERAP